MYIILSLNKGLTKFKLFLRPISFIFVEIICFCVVFFDWTLKKLYTKTEVFSTQSFEFIDFILNVERSISTPFTN